VFIYFAAALMLVAPSVSAAAQEKGKEQQKPSNGAADAWRQALPPEAEVEGTSEAPAAAARRASAEANEKALLALERKWMGALQERDAGALNQLISEDFTLVSPRLVVAAGDRDKYFLHAMRDLSVASYDFEALTVRLYGRTAIVGGRLKQSAGVAGEDWGGTYLFTDVWVSRDGAWRVVSRHASLLPPEKK